MKLGLWFGVMFALVRRERLRLEVAGERGDASFAVDVGAAVTARSGCEQGLCMAADEPDLRRRLGVVGRCWSPCTPLLHR